MTEAEVHAAETLPVCVKWIILQQYVLMEEAMKTKFFMLKLTQ